MALFIAHPEMDEEGIKAIQSEFQGKFFDDTSNPSDAGYCWENRFRNVDGNIFKIWCLNVVFLYPEHFINTPGGVMWHLNHLSEELRRYREGLPIKFTIEPVRQSNPDPSSFPNIPQKDIPNGTSTDSRGVSGFIKKFFKRP